MTIQWADGHQSAYDFELLRWNCPCAECAGEMGVPGKLATTSELNEDLLGDLAVAEHHDVGNPPDAIPLSQSRLLIDVDLGDLDFGMVDRELLENRRQHLARAAPIGVKVHDHRLVRENNLVLKCGGRNVNSFTHDSPFLGRTASRVTQT